MKFDVVYAKKKEKQTTYNRWSEKVYSTGELNISNRISMKLCTFLVGSSGPMRQTDEPLEAYFEAADPIKPAPTTHRSNILETYDTPKI